ncbi:DUF433 domain-containing protein [Candidatus Poribacteria bacterium]|nr:DUF433 domain-containing protein [Candidatus Poribacteria bacterium]MYG08141.1 DUF433 domain-containing protein [Candidatus Poribacteria bacterium]MYK23443.1 DUF433 domain-containing protein [Candidatus Poribacteria bacterium]
MELENYFDFVQEDVIRIKGNRIDIEIVLEDYLEGASPEEILLRYPTLNPEKIHATILYYLAKTEEVEAYLERVRQLDEEAEQEQLWNPSPFVIELRERFAKASQELLAAKRKPTKPVDTLSNV